MKKSISLLLALLLCVSCLSLTGAAETDPVEELKNKIDSFLTVTEMFNDCDSHWIDQAEMVANVNSGALRFERNGDNLTQGLWSAAFIKRNDNDCDIPMMVRNGTSYYLSAFTYLEFDLYVSEDMVVNGAKPAEGENVFATVKLQSGWTNNIDDATVHVFDILDEVNSLKAGEWHHFKLPLPADSDATFKQITIRPSKFCFSGPTDAYLLLDNVILTHVDGRDIEMSDKEGLEALQADYATLSDEQKAAVTNWNLVEKWIDELKTAEDAFYGEVRRVEGLIDELPDPQDVTLEDEDAIANAEIELDLLTYEERKAVANKDKLTAVREALDGLKKDTGAFRGDVNGDKETDAKDALLVLQTAVGKATLTDTQKTAADLNDDSAINAADALIILQIAVGKA